VVEVPAPLGPEAWPLFETVWHVLALSPVPPERESELLPLTRLLRSRGAAVGAGALMATLGELQAQVRLGARRTAGCDLLLCPTLAAPQAPVGWFTAGGTRRPISTGSAVLAVLRHLQRDGGPSVSCRSGRRRPARRGADRSIRRRARLTATAAQSEADGIGTRNRGRRLPLTRRQRVGRSTNDRPPDRVLVSLSAWGRWDYLSPRRC
jgi:amidase